MAFESLVYIVNGIFIGVFLTVALEVYGGILISKFFGALTLFSLPWSNQTFSFQ